MVERHLATDGPPAGPAGAATAELHPSIEAIPREAWNAVFPGEPEDWDYYRAAEDAPPEGFTVGVVVARGADGALLAAAPCFQLSYRLDTPFQGRLRGWLDRLHARWPGLTALKVVGLGSPLADTCSLGFAPETDDGQRRELMRLLLQRLNQEADEQRAAIVAVKGLGPEAAMLGEALKAEKFSSLKSVPVVILDVPFPDLPAYLASLKRRYRSYFRSKMKTRPQLRIEIRTSAAGLEDELVALYDATLAQSGVSYADFDRIGPGYFATFLERQRETARLMLIWHGETLVGFHLFHAAERRLLSNKMGMRYPDARELNLYFINWLELIEYATARGIGELEMGATTYAAKMLFGGRLETRWVHFRFRNAVANVLTRPLHGLFDFERNDPELKRMRAEGRLEEPAP